jgi:hypothetical protein
LWREAWNGEHERDDLDRHVVSSVRMLDARFAELGPDVTYSGQILGSVVLMLLRVVRPGGAFEIPGCRWEGVELPPTDEILLIDPIRGEGGDPSDARHFIARLGGSIDAELASRRARSQDDG